MDGNVLYLSGTNTVSYLIGDRSSAARAKYLAVEHSSTISISSLTEAEILLGFAKQISANRLKPIFKELLLTGRRFVWDSKAAASYAFLKTAMSREGLRLTLIDQSIASHAHAVGAILVTHDRAFTASPHGCRSKTGHRSLTLNRGSS